MCDTSSFTQHHNLLRHVRNTHGGLWSCKDCGLTYNREDNFNLHRQTCSYLTTGVRTQAQTGTGKAEERKQQRKPKQSALNGTSKVFSDDLSNNHQTADNIMELLKNSIDHHKSSLLIERESSKAIKFSSTLRLLFHHLIDASVPSKTDITDLYPGSY